MEKFRLTGIPKYISDLKKAQNEAGSVATNLPQVTAIVES